MSDRGVGISVRYQGGGVEYSEVGVQTGYHLHSAVGSGSESYRGLKASILVVVLLCSQEHGEQ